MSTSTPLTPSLLCHRHLQGQCCPPPLPQLHLLSYCLPRCHVPWRCHHYHQLVVPRSLNLRHIHAIFLFPSI
ncbi:hypothetical protein EUGRSUZ_F01716 [Eucalyptus grandis]|uniref:Uncharacterized protein n=2 Tax=Eucalyptus grandis TaxID=71139 RepID=A0ACC3KG52_EUCGR|nr:hypothetical protein EUGRSUZ_F01716 [Eucalyptus grandis]